MAWSSFRQAFWLPGLVFWILIGSNPDFCKKMSARGTFGGTGNRVPA